MKPETSAGLGHEKQTGPEKQNVEKLKKEQKNFEAIKQLKVFLKNTKGKTSMQKDLLKKVFKIKK
jgi:hypothetical protein